MKKNISVYLMTIVSTIMLPMLLISVSSVNAQISPPIVTPTESGGGTSNPNTTGAGTPNTTSVNVTIKNPFNGGDSLMDLLGTILNKIILPIAAIAVTMWIIWAGFQFVLAQGNPGAIDKAKSNLLWSLIGAGILLGAVGISEAVQKTFEAFK